MEPLWSTETHPGEFLAIRRHTDRCFHAVEEEFPDGFILDGILVPRDEVAEIRRGTHLSDTPAPPSCPRRQDPRTPGTQ